jgi:CRP-like cAMP-binding protein
MTSAVSNPFDPIRLTEVRSLGGPVLDLEVRAGSELLVEGQTAGTFFVLRSGTALLVRDECPVSTLSAGDCFGELDPLAPGPQPYGVITASDVRLLAFSSFGIGRLCDAIPGVGDRLREAIAQPPAVKAGYKVSPTRSRSAAASSTVTVL